MSTAPPAPSDEAAGGKVLVRGLGFTEGPVRLQDGRRLITSVDRGLVYDISGSEPVVLADVGGGPNGATEGQGDVIYLAQNGRGIAGPDLGAGCVEAILPDGSRRRLAEQLHTPNDLCFGPDGLLYVTDPTRPLGSRDGRIWRVDTASGEAELLAEVAWYPNGIAFGPEDDAVYVANSDAGQIIRYPLEGGRLGQGEPVIRMTHGRPDGFAFDIDGNLVVAAFVPDDSAEGQFQVWSPGGEALEVIEPGMGAHCTNVFIEPAGTMFVTIAYAGVAVAYDHGCPGLPLHPFRR